MCDSSGFEIEMSTSQGVAVQGGLEYPAGEVPDLGSNNIKHVIRGRPSFAVATVFLEDGESITSDGGSMMWMDSKVSVRTHLFGTFSSACGRCCAGESCCFNTYTGPGRVTFGFNLPGQILPFVVTPETGWIFTPGAFIAGSPSIRVGGKFPGLCACLFSGESDGGLMMTRVTSEEPALIFAGGFGDIIRHDLAEGQTLFVDNGLFFAARDTTKLKIQILGGAKTCCFGGEGFVMQFHGPNTIYTQSRNPGIETGTSTSSN